MKIFIQYAVFFVLIFLLLEKIHTNIQQIMSNTSQQYDKVIAVCRELFSKKMKDIH